MTGNRPPNQSDAMGMVLGWHSLGALGWGLAVAAVVGFSVLSRVGELSAQGGRSVWDGIYTAAQAERGAQRYADSCSECHGSGLEGGEMEPPLTGGEFMYAWDGLSVSDLFERIRISMPPADPNSVSRQDKADIVAYLLSHNGVPAGEAELSRRASDLRAISLDAVQP